MLILFLVLEVIPCGIRLIGALGWLTLPSCHDAFDFSALDALHFCSRQGGPFSKVCPLVALFWFLNLFMFRETVHIPFKVSNFMFRFRVLLFQKELDDEN